MSQIERDIAFCIDECDMSNEEIGDMLRACERLGGIAVEYFCEEFIFITDEPDDIARLHNDEYLNIAEFNALHWEQ